MPNQKRRSQSSRKQFTGKQFILAQRSRSIKASLLKSLSIDLAALYYLNPQREDREHKTRETPITKSESQYPAIASQSQKHEESDSQFPNKAEPSTDSEIKQLQASAVPQLNEQTDKPQKEAVVVLLIARCIAFLIGLLIYYATSIFFPYLLILGAGIAIAVSGTSILAAVTLAPWNRKLLWNLCSLFGGLLFAVFVL